VKLTLKVSARDIIQAKALVDKLELAEKDLAHFDQKLGDTVYTRLTVNWLAPKPPTTYDKSEFQYVTMASMEYDEELGNITNMVRAVLTARIETIKERIAELGIELEE
jgi:hypothetical protein